ncbi:MAG: selenoprotein B glycine/betaine/sarcosine/D-proline reductase [Deltaproteobacteria bacterium]|nr:selenoprotein B glycine/betaine/sarcosine/D-proline reductase [Deltaproteobacteria bacterium]
MARLKELSESQQKSLTAYKTPIFEPQSWVKGPPLRNRRVALISTAGVHLRNDRPFGLGAGDYRIISGDTEANDLVMSHVSANFDRTGFQQDWNVVFPLDRLRELADQGKIGSLAAYHYSFMGGTIPEKMETEARKLAGILSNDEVNAVLLAPA